MSENPPEDGRRTVSDQAIITTVRELEPRATTTEIAETVGFDSRQAADYRLRQLEDEGTVESEMISRTKLWSVTGA